MGGVEAPVQITEIIRLLGRLPGFGRRSARRAILHLLKHRDGLMRPLGQALLDAADQVSTCSRCGNLDTEDPCGICRNPERDQRQICVVKEVADLWALERSATYRGLYHVTGGLLSALDGIGPDDLNIPMLCRRAAQPEVEEVILAMDATVDGQITAHYLVESLADCGVTVTRLARGVPVGGELEYLDDGTLSQALEARRTM